MKKKLNRVFIFISVFSVLFSSFVFVVAADFEDTNNEIDVINYRDYVTRIDVSGDNYINYLNFPTALGTWVGYAKDNDSIFQENKGVYQFHFFRSKITSSSSGYFNILYKPFDEQLLNLNNIPNGSTLGFDLDFYVFTNQEYYAFFNIVLDLHFYDVFGNKIDYQRHNLGVDSYGNPLIEDGVLADHLVCKTEVPITKPEGGRYVRMLIYLSPSTQSSISGSAYNNFTISGSLFDTSRFYLSILQNYHDNETGRLTNSILGSMESQNQQIIDGTGDQIDQVVDDVGQLDSDGDRLASLTDDMRVDKPDLGQLDVSIGSFIPESDILIYTAPLMTIWENRTLLSFVMIVLTLVLISWVMFGKK